MDLPNRPPSVNIQVRINDAQSNNKSLRTREMDMQYTPYKPLLKRLRAIVPAYLGAQDCDIR